MVRLRTISYGAHTTSYVGRTMSYSTAYVRYRTYDVTYDIEHRNRHYVVRLSTLQVLHATSQVGRTISYVPENACLIRYRTSKKTYDIVGLLVHVVYDVVGAYRIRCRRYCLLTYDVVYYIRYSIFHTIGLKPTKSQFYIRNRMSDIRCRTSHHQVYSSCGNDPSAPP